MSDFCGTLTASVSGGDAQIRKNGTGTWGTSITVSGGDTINIHMTSSSFYYTDTTATVTIGSTVDTWTITTDSDPGTGQGG